jgi:hypothetical protein
LWFVPAVCFRRGARPVPCNTKPRTRPVSKSRGWRSVRTRRSRPVASTSTILRSVPSSTHSPYCDINNLSRAWRVEVEGREAARPVSGHGIPVNTSSGSRGRAGSGVTTSCPIEVRESSLAYIALCDDQEAMSVAVTSRL